MWGTIVNSAAILGGALLGTLVKKGFSRKVRLTDKFNNILMQGIGLSVVIIGISNALKTQNMLLVIISLVIGGIIGQAVGVEKKLNSLGDYAQKKLGNGQNSIISEGFVTASLIYCVGAMAIVGSLDAGLKNDYTILYAKSMLDGITSIVLASTLGIGVAFSAIAVFVYQGAITLASGVLSPFLSDAVVSEMTAVGGILILGIGLSMLEIKKFNIGNLLPAILIPPIYFSLVGMTGQLMQILS
ncbi:MAG: DUF554 domain-containing protein [Caldicoprobacterales bacterium]|nr:DUF554 domain-containing protein [Clostridiales bacterium]